MQKSSAFPWHALLFALFPVVSLLANNVGQVDYSIAYRSFALSLVVSAAILLAAKWLLRDWQKAGILVGRHRVLGALWPGLLILSILWVVI